MATLHQFTIDEYNRVFPEAPVELLGGQIYDKMNIGPKHQRATNKIQLLLIKSGRTAITGPVQWDDWKPEPDVTVLKSDDYSGDHPTPDEIEVVFEVAESSLELDRTIKAPAYKKAGIKCIILNLKENVFEIDGKQHRSIQIGQLSINAQDL